MCEDAGSAGAALLLHVAGEVRRMGKAEVRDGSRLWRVRWAAIGAAIAVSVGGGGVFIADAVAGPSSSVVTIDPVRILDTRTDVGLAGPFVSAVSQKLAVAGTVAVPVGATGVLLNVTVVGPTAAGFLSVRPGDATGAPSTSSLNFAAGDIVPNAVQVALPTTGANAGKIDITYDAFGVTGPTTEVLIDVVGYLVVGGGGAQGPQGIQGLPGTPGLQGVPGTPGLDGIPLAGQFTLTQNIHGAILTCTSVGVVGAITSCQGVKLNGMDMQASSGILAICTAVTGKNPAGNGGNTGTTNPYLSWNGTKWEVNSGTALSAYTSIACFV